MPFIVTILARMKMSDALQSRCICGKPGTVDYGNFLGGSFDNIHQIIMCTSLRIYPKDLPDVLNVCAKLHVGRWSLTYGTLETT